jgi:hypothetical protein
MANNKHWTDDEIATLKQIVGHFDVQKRGFETAAKALNRTVSACQTKYNEIHKSTRHVDLEATRKILYDNITKNPGNLQEAFRITSKQIGRPACSIENAYYSKTHPYSRHKNDTCFMMLSKDKAAKNSKIFSSKDAHKPTRQRIKIWIAQLLGIRKEDL